MKKKFSIILVLLNSVIVINSQSLYLPNGTAGIGVNTTNSNVGIGTNSAPAGKLTIQYPYNVSPSLTSSQFAPFILNNAGAEIAMGVDANSPFLLWLQARCNNTYRDFLINPLGGNVGIGTNKPGTKLDIIHSPKNHIVVGSLSSYIAGDNYLLLQSLGTYSEIGSWNSTTGYNDLSLVPNGGKVGIGTNKPDYALDVVGTIRAHHVKVNLDKAADFVFDPSYKLPKLAEVESYVKEHKHLPSVPSADEFNKNGMDVSEMNNLMLQKIEELTLYVIEQKKAVDSLKIENKRLKNQVEKIVNK
jgi:hypothetical protein